MALAPCPPHTFLWHDYETFGLNPRRDRPAQFAAIRTDAELNEIGEPLMTYCQPAPDFLPDPQACLLTGITPQQCLEHGVPEHLFAASIHQALSANNTIGVGYNTIRFDDEVTRFLFWRNLIDPYGREWQNGCGRWDILDMVRAAYALRPEGITWPTHPDGRPSFKLEHLTQANGIGHEAAHDALSDVRATIALARLIRERQPKLFDFCFSLCRKDRVAEEIGWPTQRPLLHITGMGSVERGCLMVVWPLAMHPSNRNEIIVWDLMRDPAELMSLDAAAIRLRMFTRTDALPEGVSRLPVKTIHLNKSPIVINQLKTLSPVMAQRWGVEMETVLRHVEEAAALPDMTALWSEVFARTNETVFDVDEALYSGFIGGGDRRWLEELRAMTPMKLAAARPTFRDERLEELVFRYRARNFPETLSAEESAEWNADRVARLLDDAGERRTVAKLREEIAGLRNDASQRDLDILNAVDAYMQTILPPTAQAA